MKQAVVWCRRVVVLFVVALFSMELQAEEPSFRPRFMVGPTGGVNISNMLFQPSVQQTIKLGYDGGVVIRYDATSYAGIWLEIDYSSRGWREKPEEHPELFYDRTLNFVNVPVMTHFMIGEGPLKLTVDAGAHFGYLLSEKSATNFPTDEQLGLVVQQHQMPVENKFAWGLGGGLGAEYHFSKYVAGIRGSYYYGLGEIYGNARKDYFGKSSEQVIAVKLYFLFAF